MWKAIIAPCLLLLGCVYFEVGCAMRQIPDNPPVRTIRLLLPEPSPRERVTMDAVVIGNVGKPISRDFYQVPVEFLEPTQLHCKVTFRPLWSDIPTPPTQVAL